MLRKRNSGFTLLELIIVVIVIGILASIALPRYIQVAEKGRVAEAKTMLATIRAAQIRYAAQYSAWATALTQLDTNVPAGRYFDFTLVPVGAIGDTTAQVATATRNTFQLPGASYNILIQQDGLLTGSVPANLL